MGLSHYYPQYDEIDGIEVQTYVCTYSQQNFAEKSLLFK